MSRSKEIAVPSQTALLVDAMNCKDEGATRLLVQRALNMIYDKKSSFDFDGGSSYDVEVSDSELDSVIALIRGIQPSDSVEAILAAQFVSLHFQGSYTLTRSCDKAKSHGMTMIRLSHQALETLQKYRQKGSNINVNYFVKNEGNAVLQTNILPNLEKFKE